MSVEFHVEREVIPVTTGGRHVPDRNWVFTDSHGHEHRFDGRDLPTLEWVVTGLYWCDLCRDDHEEGEWRCRVCGDVVEPHYGWSGPETTNVPGLTTATLKVDGDVYVLTREELDALTLTADAKKNEALLREFAASRPPDASEDFVVWREP